MRSEKKNEIIAKLESLETDLEEYFKIWKKSGGGTTGHAIGSMINGLKEKTNFFKKYC